MSHNMQTVHSAVKTDTRGIDPVQERKFLLVLWCDVRFITGKNRGRVTV